MVETNHQTLQDVSESIRALTALVVLSIATRVTRFLLDAKEGKRARTMMEAHTAELVRLMNQHQRAKANAARRRRIIIRHTTKAFPVKLQKKD
jgi:RecA/RadA recombinase